MSLLLAALAGYVLGAVPVGLMIGRLTRGVDIRRQGSGRIGTTNALRALGPVGAALVLLLDAGKGVAAVLLGRAILTALDPSLGEWGATVGGVAAVIGHTRSIFIGFGGGRGVATGGGAMLAASPLAIAVVAPIFAVVVWRTRYVSAGSLTAAVIVPLMAAALAVLGAATIQDVVLAAGAGLVVIGAHADNVARLRAGTERRLGER